MAGRADGAVDLPARVLAAGLAALVVIAPLPLGAVGPRGRLTLEAGAFALLALWAGRALLLPTPLPPLRVRLGLAGMLGLAAFQALPLGEAAVATISPRSFEIRSAARPAAAVEATEERLLGIAPSALDRAASISLDPGATASALRTGAALAALLVVATTVAALVGARWLALALLVSAAFQGLYGLLVVASGHDRIWHLPKKYFLDSATGTFVNRNHFACLLAMSLACGAALILDEAERQGRRYASGGALRKLVSADGCRIVALGLLLAVGLAGLLLSFSRAGIAVGLAAVVATLLCAGRRFRPAPRLLLIGLVLAAALVPLVQIGADRLVSRYRATVEEAASRVLVWSDTLALAADFPLTGAGYGTFAATYPLYRSAEVRKYFAHAHNDPLQALAEGGSLGLLFLALLLWPVLRALAGTLAGAKGTLAVGFAAGLAAMLLHALVDFNFHIPANAATAAVLAGTVLGLPWQRRT